MYMLQVWVSFKVLFFPMHTLIPAVLYLQKQSRYGTENMENLLILFKNNIAFQVKIIIGNTV